MIQILNTFVAEKYDNKRDLLFLHAENCDLINAYGVEPEAGILMFKNINTNEFMGITIMDCCLLTEKRTESLKRLGINIDLKSICEKQIKSDEIDPDKFHAIIAKASQPVNQSDLKKL